MKPGELQALCLYAQEKIRNQQARCISDRDDIVKKRPGLKRSDVCYDLTTGCVFKIIDEVNKGRGVQYVGKWDAGNQVVRASEVKGGERLMKVVGEQLIRPVMTTVNQDKEFHAKATHWLEYFISGEFVEEGIAYRCFCIPLNAETSRDIKEAAFLINTGDTIDDCNCGFKFHDLEFSVVALSKNDGKNGGIKPGTVLAIQYDPKVYKGGADYYVNLASGKRETNDHIYQKIMFPGDFVTEERYQQVCFFFLNDQKRDKTKKNKQTHRWYAFAEAVYPIMT